MVSIESANGGFAASPRLFASFRDACGLCGWAGGATTSGGEGRLFGIIEGMGANPLCIPGLRVSGSLFRREGGSSAA